MVMTKTMQVEYTARGTAGHRQMIRGAARDMAAIVKALGGKAIITYHGPAREFTSNCPC